MVGVDRRRAVTCIRITSHHQARSGSVCTDDSPVVDPNPACPNSANHTPSPAGYVAASAWAG